MMTGREIAAGLRGAWRLARGDEGGLTCFDPSPAGFWRSFAAALLVAPPLAVLIALGGTLSAPHDIVRQLLLYVIDWLAFPVIMADLAVIMGRGDSYRRYIVAHNWSTVIQTAILFPAALLGAALGEMAGGSFGLAALVAVMLYQWFIARAALKVSAGTAVGIVFLDALLSLLISNAASQLS